MPKGSRIRRGKYLELRIRRVGEKVFTDTLKKGETVEKAKKAKKAAQRKIMKRYNIKSSWYPL